MSNDISVEKLKSICSVLDDEPVLSKELLKLAEFMKEHYFCTYYDAVKTMLCGYKLQNHNALRCS